MLKKQKMRTNYKGISINTSKNTHEKIFSLINNNKENFIVDIPCGSGAFTQRLKDNNYNNIFAIDIKNEMEIDHDNFIIGNMNDKLPFKDESIDTLVCIDGIEHINKQFDFVDEVYRILKINGEFIISTPNISSLRSRWKWLTTGHHHKCNSPLDETNPNPLHHISMISYPEIRYLLHTKGFRINTVTTNRIKIINWLFLIFIPLVYILTSWVYYKTGKKNNMKIINSEIKKRMFSLPVLLGETLIVKAKKIGNIH